MASVTAPEGCNLTCHKYGGDTYPVAYPCPFCKVHSRINALDRYYTPTTCFEARDSSAVDDLYTATLFAEGMAKIVHDVYPQEIHDISKAILPYDEPLHPIPVGASVFYLIMTAWMTTFYFTYLGRKLLAGVKQKLDLHPEADKFPNLPLYWIQQSQREAELRREVRNTWAWLARRYLLSPNDPLLDNVDQVLGLVNWHDFEVSRTAWSLIKIVLTVNSMYVRVRRNRKLRTKRLDIIKDVTLGKRKELENDPVHTTRVIIVNTEEGGEHYQDSQVEPPTKEAEKSKKIAKVPQDSRAIDKMLRPPTGFNRMDGGDSGQQQKHSRKSILQKPKHISGQISKKVPPPPPPTRPKSKSKITKAVSPVVSPKPKKPPSHAPMRTPSKVRFSKKASAKKTVQIGGTTTAGESVESVDLHTKQQRFPEADTDTVDTTAGVGGSSGGGGGGLTTASTNPTNTTTTSANIEETSTPSGHFHNGSTTDYMMEGMEVMEGATSTTTAAAEGRDVLETSSSTGAAGRRRKRRKKRRKKKDNLELEDESTERRKKKKKKKKAPRVWRYFFNP